MYPGWQPVQHTYMPHYQIVHMQPQPGWNALMPRQPIMSGNLPPQGSAAVPLPHVENNPPLPPEPPPEDDKSEIDLKPKDALEELKLQELKNKAAQWQQTLQMQQQTLQIQQQWPVAPAPMMGFQTPLDFIKKEEEEFNVQYNQWKKQYDDWREQNKSHPNKEQYNTYLQQWQTYERQMEDKKVDILQRKEEAKKQMREQEKAAAKESSYAMPNHALMNMMPGSNFMGPPPPFVPHNFGGPPMGPRGPFGSGPPVPVGPQGSMVGRPPMSGPPMHHIHDPNAPLPGFSAQMESKPQGPVNDANKTFNNGDQKGAGRGSVQSTNGSGGAVSGSAKEVPIESGQKGLNESAAQSSEKLHTSKEKPIDNLQLLEDMLNSDSVRVNKILLRKITDDSKKVLSKLDEEGRAFLTAFEVMNPAQLNILIRVINSMGEQQKVLEDLGGLTPQILNRMKKEMKDEISKMQVNVSEINAGRAQGKGSDAGRGKGYDMGRGGGIERSTENTDTDMRQGNDINKVTGGDMKTGTEMDFGQGNGVGIGKANSRGRSYDNGRGRFNDMGRGRGGGGDIKRGNDVELDLGNKMDMEIEMDIETSNDMEFGQVDDTFLGERNRAEVGRGNDMGLGRGNALGKESGNAYIEMKNNFELNMGNSMSIARGRGHDMGRGKGSDLSIGRGNMRNLGVVSDMDIARGRGSDVRRGRGSDVGRGRGNDMGIGRGYDVSVEGDVGMGREIDRDLGRGNGMAMATGRGNDVGMGRVRQNDMGRRRGNDVGMGRGNDVELWPEYDAGMTTGQDMGRGRDVGIGNNRGIFKGRGNDMALGRGRGNDMGRGRGNYMGRGRGNDVGRGRGNDSGMGRGNDMELFLGNDTGAARGYNIGRGDMGRGRGNDMHREVDMIRGRGNDLYRGRGAMRGGPFGSGRGVDNQRNRFPGAEQSEDDTYDENQFGFGPDSFDDNQEPPVGPSKRPVSLLDLNFDKPFSSKKTDGKKIEQNQMQNLAVNKNERSQTFAQKPASTGGIMGQGSPGLGPRGPVRCPVPGSIMPRGMMRPPGMRQPRMMGPRGMMTASNIGLRSHMDHPPDNQPEMFEREIFHPHPEDENNPIPSFEFESPQSSITANTSADSLVPSTTTLTAVGPSQSNDKTDIKPDSTGQGSKPLLPKLGQESSNFNQRSNKGPGFQQDFAQRMTQDKSQEKRPEPPNQILGGQFNKQPFRRTPQQMQLPVQHSLKELGVQFRPRPPFQRQRMPGGQFQDASKQQQVRDRQLRGMWGPEIERPLGGDMGIFRGRGRGLNREQDIAGERFGRDRSTDRGPSNEKNEPWRRGPPNERHMQWNQDQQYDNNLQFQEDQDDIYGDEYGAGEAQENYTEEGHVYAEPGYEDDQGYMEQGFGEHEAFAEGGEPEYLEDVHAFEYRPEVTPRLEADTNRFGEQFREPERFPPDDRFLAQEQSRDPYRQLDDQYPMPPFRDPYDRPFRRDPFDRLDSFKDPYDPYAKWSPLDDYYRVSIEDRDIGLIRQAETIDYGHMPPALLRGEDERGFQTPSVIDYGHGQAADHWDPGFSSRLQSNVPASVDDRRDMFREQAPPMDRNFPSPFIQGTPAGSSTGPPPGLPPAPAKSEPKIEVVKVEDILNSPGRNSRPTQIVVIVRGLPGSGKSYVSKLLKDKEVSKGGGAPRMLCLDDYFMIEVDKVDKDPESGKRIKKKVLEYEYEAEMESAYRQNMLKSFKKTLDDGFFPFIIVDAVFDRIKHFEEFWSYAKSKGFQVYVVELQCDVAACAKRNTHKRTQKEIEKIQSKWEETPAHYIKLDIRSLLQDDSITEVEMEDTQSQQAQPPPVKAKPEEEEEEEHLKRSKWELDLSEGNLDKLDGLQHSKKKHAATESSQSSMEEFLQLADEYFTRQIQEPGKKRVRWADLEERKNSEYRRDLGFVVGQTHEDWQRITDPHYADRQLKKTKYF